YNGEEVLRDARERLQPDRRRVVLMFQDATGSLSPRMNVRSQLLEPFEIHSMDKGDRDQRVSRLLDAVGLSERLADAYPHELSGGQARRVGIARALALEPDLIIADEPTAGLDVSIQGGVLNLLSSLQERMGLSMMIVTHNLNIVRHVADRMAIMYLGRFVEQGPSAELLDQPRHPYTRALLSANPSPDPDAVGERLELAGEVPSLLARPNGCEFHTRCPIVQSDCRETAPTVRQTGDGHRFSCHHPMTDSPLLDD
ncbi:MAG: ATP-binding cassette domain-containing protein, partial [Acidobacteriota bacterium]|nr:ATP-binding cassette domain-containing protein [Acidobacteriota bacterium]